jgi:hypothetical protein
MDHMTMVEPRRRMAPDLTLTHSCANSCGAGLHEGRHHRGWPRFQLLTWVTVTDQSWRYCIEPMGYRDTIWERSGYVELIRWQTGLDYS